MASAEDYVGLITSQHADKPKFVAMVAAVAKAFADTSNLIDGLPQAFDLDVAVGAQLDDVGLWVGLSRKIGVPIEGVYFSFDTEGLGYDQGSWKGPFDPDVGLTSLDDDTYRLLLRARIAANHWDGTFERAVELLELIFVPNPTDPIFQYLELESGGLLDLLDGPPVALVSTLQSGGTSFFLQDNSDMTIDFFISGVIPPALTLALFGGGYIPIKPEGIRVNGHYVTSVNGAPVFGFDTDSKYISGFDKGAWATPV